MALTSTLFTGLSGLNVNQTKLNVVGNNIANVNTIAFKSSRALFKPQFYVTDAGGTPADGDFGGSNPSQRGLGATIATVQKDFSNGSIEPTGKATDLAIEGDGFFVVRGTDQKYTRDGSFTLNEANQLVTTGGEFVQGYGVDEDANVQVGRLQNIDIPLGSLTQAIATENATFEGNLNANGLVATGASILNSGPMMHADGVTPVDPTTALIDLRNPADLATPLFAAGSTLTLAGSRGGRNLPALTFDINGLSTVQELQQFFNQGMTLDTASAPPAGTALISALPGDPAGSVRLQMTGHTGQANALSLAGTAFSNSANSPGLSFTDDAASNPSGESVATSFVAYDSLGTPITVNVTAGLESKANTGNTWRFYATSAGDTDAATFDPAAVSEGSRIGTGTMTFDSEGRLTSSTGTTVVIHRNNTGAGSAVNLNIDFSSMTSLASSESSLTATGVDGSPIGTLSAFSVGVNGIITGMFDNGLTRTLGQVAMATFNNPQGLQDMGGNMYMTGGNSGEPIIAAPLQLGAGAIRSGALELSNVDLSEEFINLIIASTGFSASSRVISTSDQLLTELLNTSR
ncbi:MAG TPA: flagellar hook-basal body complex protein [Tepidisphaeraceae bacterium]|nr:flagellar hook-basal body complex protein [Tepidisphaeraceae bacterium]